MLLGRIMRDTFHKFAFGIVVAGLVAAMAVPAAGAAPDTVGAVDPGSGLWSLRDEAGNTYRFYFGNPGDLPFAGDWDCDGIDTPGLYRQSDGYVYLSNANIQGNAEISFFFGNPGDIPIAGDFNGDGCDTVSIYRPSQSRVFVINELGDGDKGLGAADYDYYFGNPGDTPFTGDFDADSIDTVGLYRETTGLVYFRNSNTQGIAEFEFYFGNPQDRFVAGDWNNNGTDSPGVFRPFGSTFYLRHANTQGTADQQFGFGGTTSNPVAGTWGDIPATPDIALQTVATGLDSPVLAVAPDGDDRLFIVEKGGDIEVLKGGSLLPTPFLSIGGVSTGFEQGLLGLAFHPNYASNGRFFVNYTDGSGNTQVVEYRATPSSDVADASPVRTIITVPQPASNHNGGMIAFGVDGYLYIGMGDGGGSNDSFGNGQDPLTLNGSMLRIDIDGTAPYTIPAGNPYNGTNGAREVWATGLRNPWRFSVDSATGDLYIGDVGQNAWEEVDVAPAGVAGLNFGWNIMEGKNCFPPGSSCSSSGLIPPVVEYPNPAEGRSVVGGYVYRGPAMPALNGAYFYADFYQGWIRSFRLQGGAATDARDWTSTLGAVGSIAGFGQDGDGELYVVTFSGTIYKIVPGVSGA